MRLPALALVGLLLAALLSGCSGSKTPDSGASSSSSTSPGSTTGPGGTTGGPGSKPGSVAGNDTTLSCVVVAGGTGISYASAGGQNIGGCSFTAKKGIDADGVVKSMTPASGCTIWYAKSASSTTSDGNAELNKTYGQGTDFGVYCDRTMTPNASSSMVVTLKP